MLITVLSSCRTTATCDALLYRLASARET
jgi:hypothetical protein